MAQSPSRPLRILAIGSSSTLGIGASSPSHSYPAQLAADLGAKWGIATEVRNAGVGGEVVSVTEARLGVELRDYQPDLVLWQVGTNDAVSGVDLKDFRAEVEAGVAIARARNVPIILVDPQFFPGINNATRFDAFVAAVGDVGAKAHVPVFSRFVMMKAWAAQSADILRASLSSDGFHMGDKGYACFADALAQDIARQRAGKSASVNGIPPGAKL
ncbi:MAG: SGNH/GDSL hydrolase family protein [Hyphomicrobiales bacterium]|nr:SGNH/GDSL hydrolase family protein [Hyphomicrobiales bacterium]MBV8664390.1 SGNH/GDSL hydrolase family protein [Hyphomicrobiales bacterium]